MVYHNSICLEKINIYILLLRAYVVRGFDVVVNTARFCRRGFVCALLLRRRLYELFVRNVCIHHLYELFVRNVGRLSR